MIERYVNDDAFNAKENLLLVPVPIGETELKEGFAGQVVHRFPVAKERLQAHFGLDEAEVLIVGNIDREKDWVPVYSLALVGIHRRQTGGWIKAPDLLTECLTKLERDTGYGDRAKIATAGIPGTGFSGLRGGAIPEQMAKVLDAHKLPITVYQRAYAGDRAPLKVAEPGLDDRFALQ